MFSFFPNMGPYRRENLKRLFLLQITDESFQASPDFFPNGPHKNTFGIFEILKLKF